MKYVFTLSLSLCSLFAQSQITIKSTPKQNVIGKSGITEQLIQYIENDDTSYVFMFRNSKYQSIVDITQVVFKDVDSTLSSFYTLMKSVFLDENKKNKEYRVKFNLGNTEVIISTYLLMGKTSVWFWTSEGYAYFTEKEVDKIFGKR